MGGGIYTYDPEASFEGCNNIIVGNYCDGSPNWFGNVYLDYSCSPELITGTGNITDDPGFADPGSNDFNLHPDSPCIDAGDPASPLDPDLTRADMGAFYYHQTAGVNDIPVSEIPSEFCLHAPYPNPFNQHTVLDFALPSASPIKLTMYDIMGREVVKLVDGYRNAGSHEVVFDAKDLTSGVYFARLKVGNFRQTQKLILLK